MRYYFDLRDENGITVDDEGVELATFAAVQDEAALSLADMARNLAMGRAAARQLTVEVRDENGPVLRARFAFELAMVPS